MVSANDFSRIRRRATDAASRVSHVAMILDWSLGETTKSQQALRFLLGTEAEGLLGVTLDSAETLARLLHHPTAEYDSEPDYERLLEAVEAVKTALLKRQGSARRRRLVERLRDTRGRTEAEAELYEAAATRLEVSHG